MVEADAMKSMDVIYKQLSKMSSFKSEPDVSSYVHEYSTKQAEALFVSAINRYRHAWHLCQNKVEAYFAFMLKWKEKSCRCWTPYVAL